MKYAVATWHPTRAGIATTAALVAVAGLAMWWRFGWTPALPAFLVFAGLGTVAGAIDLAILRVPNAIVVPAMIGEASLLTVAAAGDGNWTGLLRALVATAVVLAFHLTLALVLPKQLGMGDVKLAACTALCLGWLGWPAVWTGILLGWLLATLAIAVRPLWRLRGDWRVLPAGPFLVGGSLIAILLSH